MRVLYLLVDETNPSPARIEQRLAAGQMAMPSGWTFAVESIRIGPAFYEENAVGHAMAIPGILHAVLKRQAEYDAVLIGCFGDPGLDAARLVATIPIVGPGEASLLLTQFFARRFGIVTILDSEVPELAAYATGLGLESRCMGIEAIGIPVAAVFEDLKLTGEKLLLAGRRLAAQGARAIVLGCMSFGFHPFDNELQEKLGIPVIDPLRASMAALQTGETLGARLGGVRPALEQPDELTRFLTQLQDAALSS